MTAVINKANLISVPRISPDGLSLATPSGIPIKLPMTKSPRRLAYVSHSIGWYGQRVRAPGIFDGRPWFLVTGTLATFGGALATCIMDSGSNAGGAGNSGGNYTGTLSSDAQGRLKWARNGDTAGAAVDVSNGGFFYLPSANDPMGLFVGVLGSSAITPNQSITLTSSGFPGTWDWDSRGPATWMAAALGEAFNDYQVYAIPGAQSSDLVKWMSYVTAQDLEAVVISIGVNDIPNTGSTLANAQSSIAAKKTLIDWFSDRCRRVYVDESFPAPVKDATAQKWLAHVNNVIHAYCLTKPNVRFVPTNYRMADYSASVAAGKTGVFDPDNLHLLSYGGWLAGAKCIAAAVAQDYPPVPRKLLNLEIWDSTLKSGSINSNPALRGTAGTYGGDGTAAGNGISGIGVPDSWRLFRSDGVTAGAGTQTCVTSIFTDPLKGQNWYALTVSGAASNNIHKIDQAASKPSGLADGDYFRLVAKVAVGGCSGGGLSTLTIQASANNSKNGIILHQLQPGAAINTFTNEFTGSGDAILELASEPQKLIAGASSFTLSISVGAYTSTGVGTVYIQNFYLEKCTGPIYP